MPDIGIEWKFRDVGNRTGSNFGGTQRRDHVFDGPDGSHVYVDPRSFRFLDGTTLDYDTSLVSKGFIFNNPNAKSSCGCGTSFSV